MSDKVSIRMLMTGVPGLDTVLGGGLPEFSFNLVAGGPGSGKTTLVHQFMFANATEERKAIYFTIFGEPPLKMLRYQQQFDFFDPSKVGSAIRFVHLGKEMIEGGLNKVLERILRQMDDIDARTVIVDSFRSVVRVAEHAREEGEQIGLEGFVQRLALTLTSSEATTFLVGEYLEQETNSNPIFTVADGILWLHQTVLRNSAVRRVQIMKMRGQAPLPGLHMLKLSDAGVQVFPRLPRLEESGTRSVSTGRSKTGISGLDEMLGGGIPMGYSTLIAGPSGSGKTALATSFVLEGIRSDETAVIALFENRPDEYLRTSPRRKELETFMAAGRIKLVYTRALDLSVDEALEELQRAVTSLGAKRLVIDSLSGFELALSPPFREDFRESLYRMVSALTGLGVTVVLTVEIIDSFTELRLNAQGASFLTDGIILQRYVEMDGRLKKVMSVVKLRGSEHSKELREYVITEHGIAVGDVLHGHRGILTGAPLPIESSPRRRAATLSRRGRSLGAAKKRKKRKSSA